MIRALRLLRSAFDRFIAHDGWAIASHIALSVLMSLFPFLILVTALTGLFGSENLANEVARLLLEAWPKEVAQPIANEIRSVLTAVRGDALAIGAILSLYFASSGVEALRVGLNRAYEAYEWRSFWITRLESIGYVIAAAIAMIAFAFLIVLFPLGWRALLRWVPGLAPFGGVLAFTRIAVAALIVIFALAIAHRLLPAGRMSWPALRPGIIFTLVFWLLGGVIFGAYLDSFAGAYVTTYAGLATAMIALVFLYVLSAIFLLGAELNGAIEDETKPRPRIREALSTF
ncbi:MAG: YihY/virulence factor BrkB family protein [Hyphomicrobiales bacterium]|jgi:membrane protein|nr:YihY/virulence factor BrkB family protein [Hyphomicrobiales bacterium]